MAWRVTAEPAVSRVIDCGPRAQSRATRASRVSSPSAAKIGSARVRPAALALARDMSLDVLHLPGPAPVVHPERFGPPGDRDAIEAGLDQGQARPTGSVLQTELDEGRGLVRIVHGRIDRVGMPA